MKKLATTVLTLFAKLRSSRTVLTNESSFRLMGGLISGASESYICSTASSGDILVFSARDISSFNVYKGEQLIQREFRKIVRVDIYLLANASTRNVNCAGKGWRKLWVVDDVKVCQQVLDLSAAKKVVEFDPEQLRAPMGKPLSVQKICVQPTLGSGSPPSVAHPLLFWKEH
jgi:hypothetical protein